MFVCRFDTYVLRSSLVAQLHCLIFSFSHFLTFSLLDTGVHPLSTNTLMPLSLSKSVTVSRLSCGRCSIPLIISLIVLISIRPKTEEYVLLFPPFEFSAILPLHSIDVPENIQPLRQLAPSIQFASLISRCFNTHNLQPAIRHVSQIQGEANTHTTASRS